LFPQQAVLQEILLPLQDAAFPGFLQLGQLALLDEEVVGYISWELLWDLVDRSALLVLLY
jgi:hypothetical protein